MHRVGLVSYDFGSREMLMNEKVQDVALGVQD